MATAVADDALARGHEALASGNWEDARDAFHEALGLTDSPEALDGLGRALWARREGRDSRLSDRDRRGVHDRVHPPVLGANVEGVADICLWPFLAVREGVPIHMPDRDAVRDHFAAMIDTYRGGGVATWKPVEIDTRELGEHAVFTTVRWNALDAEGQVLRDTRTTYHLLATSDGWRLLSYTNHF